MYSRVFDYLNNNCVLPVKYNKNLKKIGVFFFNIYY